MEAAQIYERLKERFGGKILDLKVGAGDPVIEVEKGAIAEVAAYLKGDPELGFDTLMCLSGVDYEKAKTFAVAYHLFSFKHRHKITLKVQTPKEEPTFPTVEGVWKAANWFEREAYDLYGIIFSGHSDLRRILLPEDWEGHPMRKDWKYPETYRGVPL